MIVFVAPTDEPLQEDADLDCERVQRWSAATVRLDADVESIQGRD